ncbi:copper acquisition factor BIM1-like domain-containing protein [Rhodotorula paludigena]|uniref:copper acquisition factor BIM1-like domain-containing protein n=1 Tax=Rhodotorula paludigena TaxID=86838 RepID=UPI00317C9CE6
MGAVLEKRLPSPTAPGPVGFNFPPMRGWSSALQNTAPCGGYDLGARYEYPVSGGDIALAFQRDAYDVSVRYSLNSNPTSNDNFQDLLPNMTIGYIGSRCLTAPDFTTLGASVGDTVTMQLTYIAGAGNKTFYECSDLTLVEAAGYNAEMDYTCANVTESTQTIPNQSANAAASSAAATAATTLYTTGGKPSGSDNGVTPLQAGWIGACVTLAVVAAFAAVLAFGGFAKFGSRRHIKSLVPAGSAAAPAYERGDRASVS